MGIGKTELEFLLYSRNKFGSLKKVLTLGRQQIGIENLEIKQILNSDNNHKCYDYCEDLLKNNFGATLVHSIDFSDYEGCTHIFDIGEEINFDHKYDTIIDFGTSEHVFNVGQVFKNIHNMLNVGGRVLHVNPANSFNGHGFHQFSHELFYSLYSKTNGYSNTQVFLNDYSNKHKGYWFEIVKSESGTRLEYSCKEPVGNLVHTIKKNDVKKLSVYQILYDYDWKKKGLPEVQKKKSGLWLLVKKFIKKLPLFFCICLFETKISRKIYCWNKTFFKKSTNKKSRDKKVN